jgi:hypothetical protein
MQIFCLFTPIILSFTFFTAIKYYTIDTFLFNVHLVIEHVQACELESCFSRRGVVGVSRIIVLRIHRGVSSSCEILPATNEKFSHKWLGSIYGLPIVYVSSYKMNWQICGPGAVAVSF